jgi:hypothetical protein
MPDLDMPDAPPLTDDSQQQDYVSLAALFTELSDVPGYDYDIGGEDAEEEREGDGPQDEPPIVRISEPTSEEAKKFIAELEESSAQLSEYLGRTVGGEQG